MSVTDNRLLISGVGQDRAMGLIITIKMVKSKVTIHQPVTMVNYTLFRGACGPKSVIEL